ncbi:MAG: hypothetical protein ACI8V0_003041, partial [Pseudohongiellaceae bacterium]
VAPETPAAAVAQAVPVAKEAPVETAEAAPAKKAPAKKKAAAPAKDTEGES